MRGAPRRGRSLARLLRTLFKQQMHPSPRMLAGTEAWLSAAWPAVPGRAGAGAGGAVTGLGALHLLHALVVLNGVSLPWELVQVLPPSALSGRSLAQVMTLRMPQSGRLCAQI